jgi:hypothetical protein
MQKYKYTTIFSSTLKPLVSEEKDKYLAMASLMEVSDFIPNIDTSQNIDLLPIAFNAAVANRVNKNGDVIDGGTALKVYKNFINKPINIEHNREKIVGTILAAGFSEFGTDKAMTETQAAEMKGPFNITLGGVIWKVASSELADLIEDSADPTSENYLKISASWELGFTDYHLVILPEDEKNIEDGQFVTESKEIELLSSHLRALGGDGKLDNGKNVYRQVVAEVVPLGIGLTETPAAEVKGVATEEDKKEDKKEEISDDQKNNSSQIETNNVNISENTMKKTIEKMKDINDESLTEMSASTITDFIKSELDKAADQYQQEMTEKEAALEVATTKSDTLQVEHDQLTDELTKVKDALGELEKANTEREAEEQFNQRMSGLDEEYVLTDEDREVIASDIKDMNKDAFTAYTAKLSVLLKDKNKATIAEADALTQLEPLVASEEKEEVKEAIASETETAVKEVVEEALENAEAEQDEVPVSSEAAEPSIYEKYAKAFGLDQFDIKIN